MIPDRKPRERDADDNKKEKAARKDVPFYIKYKFVIILFIVGFGGSIIFNWMFPGLWQKREQEKAERKRKSNLKSRVVNNYTIVDTYIRDEYFLTQGFTFLNPDTLVESAGESGNSVIQLLDAKSMKVIKRKELDKKYSAKGCAVVERGGIEEIIQLTWKDRKILVWDAKNLELKRELELPKGIKEGWGILARYEPRSDGLEFLKLYITDGTSFIHIVNGDTGEYLDKIPVTKLEGAYVYKLNELEWINGKIWANIYNTKEIAVIDPVTGSADPIFELTPIYRQTMKKSEELGQPWSFDYVLNAVAYDYKKERLLITGKKWPWMVELKLEIPPLVMNITNSTNSTNSTTGNQTSI